MNKDNDGNDDDDSKKQFSLSMWLIHVPTVVDTNASPLAQD